MGASILKTVLCDLSQQAGRMQELPAVPVHTCNGIKVKILIHRLLSLLLPHLLKNHKIPLHLHTLLTH
jgi:hypothetical protein